MALMKHVVREVVTNIINSEGDVIGASTEMVGFDEAMTPDEEAEFLATLPGPLPHTEPAEPTKTDLMAELVRIQKQIEALP